MGKGGETEEVAGGQVAGMAGIGEEGKDTGEEGKWACGPGVALCRPCHVAVLWYLGWPQRTRSRRPRPNCATRLLPGLCTGTRLWPEARMAVRVPSSSAASAGSMNTCRGGYPGEHSVGLSVCHLRCTWLVLHPTQGLGRMLPQHAFPMPAISCSRGRRRLVRAVSSLTRSMGVMAALAILCVMSSAPLMMFTWRRKRAAWPC